MKKNTEILMRSMVNFLNRYPRIKAVVYLLLVATVFFSGVKIMAFIRAEDGDRRVRQIWTEIPVYPYIHVRYFNLEQMPIEHVLMVKGKFDLPNETVDKMMKDFLGETYYIRNGRERVGLYKGYTIRYWFKTESNEWVFIVTPDERKKAL